MEYYWIIYFQVYLICTALLLWEYRGDLQDGDRLTRIYLSAAIFGASAGASAGIALIVEAGGYLVLLIPARIRQLKNEGREEARAEARAEIAQAREEAAQARAEAAQARAEAREEAVEAARAQALTQALEQARAETAHRYAQAFALYGQTQNGQPILPVTPEIQRYLQGETPIIPPQPPITPPQTPNRPYRRRRPR